MKPKFLKVPKQVQQSFSVRYDIVPHFYKELHFHPEIELIHIHKGTGTQLVGNKLHRFNPGDMIFMGADLPHMWKSDEQYFKSNTSLKVEATVIHFLPYVFGEGFLKMPENDILEKLFIKAKRGLKITKKTKLIVGGLMEELLKAPPAKRISLLIDTLHLLGSSKDMKLLNDKDLIYEYSEKSNERMNNVMQFLFSNYSNVVSLKEIAQIANMSTNAFCRYFKITTKKTFSAFILELRINHACKLLTETDKSIGTTCYESGFGNLSNFNRYFKKAMNCTPLQYRSKFAE